MTEPLEQPDIHHDAFHRDPPPPPADNASSHIPTRLLFSGLVGLMGAVIFVGSLTAWTARGPVKGGMITKKSDRPLHDLVADDGTGVNSDEQVVITRGGQTVIVRKGGVINDAVWGMIAGGLWIVCAVLIWLDWFLPTVLCAIAALVSSVLIVRPL